MLFILQGTSIFFFFFFAFIHCLCLVFVWKYFIAGWKCKRCRQFSNESGWGWIGHGISLGAREYILHSCSPLGASCGSAEPVPRPWTPARDGRTHHPETRPLQGNGRTVDVAQIGPGEGKKCSISIYTSGIGLFLDAGAIGTSEHGFY